MKDKIKKQFKFPIVAYIIKRRGKTVPWSNQFFLSTEEAEKWFMDFTDQHDLAHLDWENYHCMKVEIIKFDK